MKKIIEFTPAFDRRHKDPSKNYGIHNVEIRFVLKGEKGAVQFVMGTGWFLPETVKEYQEAGKDLWKWYPMAIDIGCHSYLPHYEGQPTITDKCPYLDGKPCYYDGSSLNADPVMDRFIREGHEAVWKELETYYKSTFGADK